MSAFEEKKSDFTEKKLSVLIYPQRPPMTYIHILKALDLLNVKVSSKLLRPFGIKQYQTVKNQFLVLFLLTFRKKKVDLLQKFSNCERLDANSSKWFPNLHVEGFGEYDRHSNSNLVSEWTGALWPPYPPFMLLKNVFIKILVADFRGNF